MRSFAGQRVRRLIEGFTERQKQRDQHRKIFNEKYNKAGKGKAVKTKGTSA
jgi:hypothetical protein